MSAATTEVKEGQHCILILDERWKTLETYFEFALRKQEHQSQGDTQIRQLKSVIGCGLIGAAAAVATCGASIPATMYGFLFSGMAGCMALSRDVWPVWTDERKRALLHRVDHLCPAFAVATTPAEALVTLYKFDAPEKLQALVQDDTQQLLVKPSEADAAANRSKKQR